MEDGTRKKIRELICEYVNEMADDRLEGTLEFVQQKPEDTKKNKFGDKIKSML